ncbi:MAG: biotin--[acetyl-CoA-carboxylase] ligase [Acidimicrobiaceae bacterium]|nr:biotin--[acetyl-CoA-carboxylase] ligase [Acidimicrobiaceae bacterium]
MSTDNNWPVNWHVHRVLETGSTNTDLYASALAGAPSHSALIADNQTAGRGRLDRTWEAKPGANLLLSLLFRTDHTCPTRDTELKLWPRIVAIAAVRACKKFIEQNDKSDSVALKWPNDLLLDGRKLGGMLSVGDPQQTFIVVGIGINIGWAPPESAALMQVIPDATPTPAELLTDILQQINILEKLNVDQQHQQYVALLATLGKNVRVELMNGTFITGLATELDTDGRLVVVEKSDTTIRHTIDTGDVVHLRDAKHDNFDKT